MGSRELVIAGSEAFVAALSDALAERTGTPPRVAATPAEALDLCGDEVGMLVYEHAGPEWLPLCSDARQRRGAALSIVVALPPEFAADVGLVSSAASAVVAWHGDARPVLDAATRVLAAAEAASRVPAPTPARVAPPAARAAPTPVQAAPVPTPVRPAPPSAPRVAPPVMTPSPAPAAALSPGVAQRPVPTPVVPRAAAPVSAEELFADIFDDEPTRERTAAPVAAGAAEVPSQALEAATGRRGAWPAAVIPAGDPAEVLRAALEGRWPSPALRPATERIVAALSLTERGALQGQPLTFDTGPLRRALGLRWQLGAALATLPPPGSPVDQEALKTVMASIDDALAALKAATEGADAAALRAMESVRHALVREAIDLTEAMQRVLPADAVEEITSSYRPRADTPAPPGRSLPRAPAARSEPRSVPWTLVVVLLLAVAAAGAYHGYRYVNRPQPPEPVMIGAPAGTVSSRTPGGRIIALPAGTRLDPAELARFTNLERAKGNDVREIRPGVFEVTPAKPAEPAAAEGAKAEPAGVAKPEPVGRAKP